ncbi:hypothetical protein D3C81_2132780 [compost metagenome]
MSFKGSVLVVSFFSWTFIIHKNINTPKTQAYTIAILEKLIAAKRMGVKAVPINRATT